MGQPAVIDSNLLKPLEWTCYRVRCMVMRSKFGSLSIIFSAAALTSVALFLLALITISIAGRMGGVLASIGHGYR